MPMIHKNCIDWPNINTMMKTLFRHKGTLSKERDMVVFTAHLIQGKANKTMGNSVSISPEKTTKNKQFFCCIDLSPYAVRRFRCLNTLRPRQNGRHFTDDIFKCIFLNENVWIAIEISLTFVPKGRINNIPALVQIMAWRRPGDKPLSEPMMVSLPTHICVTRPQWDNTLRSRQNGLHFPDDILKCILLNENMFIWIKISLAFIPKGPINNISAFVQAMAWHLHQWWLV